MHVGAAGSTLLRLLLRVASPWLATTPVPLQLSFVPLSPLLISGLPEALIAYSLLPIASPSTLLGKLMPTWERQQQQKVMHPSPSSLFIAEFLVPFT
jgi:hypothetical protein